MHNHCDFVRRNHKAFCNCCNRVNFFLSWITPPLFLCLSRWFVHSRWLPILPAASGRSTPGASLASSKVSTSYTLCSHEPFLVARLLLPSTAVLVGGLTGTRRDGIRRFTQNKSLFILIVRFLPVAGVRLSAPKIGDADLSISYTRVW